MGEGLRLFCRYSEAITILYHKDSFNLCILFVFLVCNKYSSFLKTEIVSEHFSLISSKSKGSKMLPLCSYSIFPAPWKNSSRLYGKQDQLQKTTGYLQKKSRLVKKNKFNSCDLRSNFSPTGKITKQYCKLFLNLCFILHMVDLVV